MKRIHSFFILVRTLDTMKARLLQTGYWEGELIHTKRNGSQIIAASRWALQKDGHGNPVAILEINNDITEKKHLEAALAKSERYFRNVVEQATDGIFIHDLNGRIVDCNRRAYEALGYTRDELLQMHVSDFDVDFSEKKDVNVWQQLKAGQILTIEGVHRRKDGSTFPAEIRVALFDPGEPKMIIGIVRDVTERKRAEEILQKSERQATQLAQESAIIAEVGRIISSTLNVEEVYERFSEEVQKIIPFDRIVINVTDTEKGIVSNVYAAGKGIEDRKPGVTYPLEGSGNAEMARTKSSLLIQTEDFDKYKDRYPMLLSTFQAGFRSIMNVPLFSKGKIIGGLLLRSLKSDAYTDKDIRLAERVGNQIAGAIANAQLFTERQRLEERLRRAEKMEALGTLAGGVAHDLNNVLGVLVGYSELLLMEIQEGSPLVRHASNILQSSQRAAAIVQDLLTLARRGVAVSEVVNLNDLISDHLKTPEFEKLKAYHPRVIFGTNLDKDLMNIKGSPFHLSKAVMNLLSNAAEAIIKGGRKL